MQVDEQGKRELVTTDTTELDTTTLNELADRVEQTPERTGYDGKIKFVTEGTMQMHLAEQDLTVANKHNQEINPVEKGHIAFRTDDIEEFKTHLKKKNIQFSDYGTAFAKEWYQIFFRDPAGNVIEGHQLLD